MQAASAAMHGPTCILALRVKYSSIHSYIHLLCSVYFCSPQIHVENLLPNMMVLGSEVSER